MRLKVQSPARQKRKVRKRKREGEREEQKEPARELYNLNLIPKTHMVDGKGSSKLSSVCHSAPRHTHKHVGTDRQTIQILMILLKMTRVEQSGRLRGQATGIIQIKRLSGL